MLHVFLKPNIVMQCYLCSVLISTNSIRLVLYVAVLLTCAECLQYISGDPDKDIAVLQLDCPPEKAASLKPVTVGTSANLLVGQKVCVLHQCISWTARLLP